MARVNGRPRRLTAEDIAMTLELRSEGIKLVSIAYYAFGMSVTELWHCMEVWGAV